jgi:hypothetical protein
VLSAQEKGDEANAALSEELTISNDHVFDGFLFLKRVSVLSRRKGAILTHWELTMAEMNRRNEVTVPALVALLDRAAAVVEISSHSFVMEEALLPTTPSTKSNNNIVDGAELWLKHFSNQQFKYPKKRDIAALICIIEIGERGNRRRR